MTMKLSRGGNTFMGVGVTPETEWIRMELPPERRGDVREEVAALAEVRR